MIKLLFTLFILGCTVPSFAQSMKMVVDKNGEVLGRFVAEKASTYTVSTQEDFDVPKLGNKVVTYSAKNGQGIVRPIKNVVNVRSTPSTDGAIIGKITIDEGMPEEVKCLGVENGWYKVQLWDSDKCGYFGKIGYVRADMAEWDGLGY